LAGYFRFIRSNLCTRNIPKKLTPRGHEHWPDKSLDEYLRRFLLEQFADNARPAQSSGASGVLEKEGGVWVLRTGQPIGASVVEETLNSIRQERDCTNLGSLR
jgi:hypothetical protein